MCAAASCILACGQRAYDEHAAYIWCVMERLSMRGIHHIRMHTLQIKLKTTENKPNKPRQFDCDESCVVCVCVRAKCVRARLDIAIARALWSSPVFSTALLDGHRAASSILLLSRAIIVRFIRIEGGVYMHECDVSVYIYSYHANIVPATKVFCELWWYRLKAVINACVSVLNECTRFVPLGRFHMRIRMTAISDIVAEKRPGERPATGQK